MEWMAELPSWLTQSCPISSLAIPGSHDSGSYSLNVSGPFAPDQTRWLARVLAIFPWIARPIVYRWSVTQNMNFQKQMELGIRYLDLRISSGPGRQEYSVVHGFFGTSVENCLDAVRSFSVSHASEIIILDFNHLYDMTKEDHEALVRLIASILGDRLVPAQSSLETITLASLWKTNGRVICIYQNAIAYSYPQLLWPSEAITSPWPNVTNVQDLIRCLDQRYQCGPPSPKAFYVTQGVITPDAPLIIRHPFSSLRDYMALEVTKEVRNWLQSRREGNWFRIVITDFVDTAELCQTVIDLNRWKQPPFGSISPSGDRCSCTCICPLEESPAHEERCPVTRKRTETGRTSLW